MTTGQTEHAPTIAVVGASPESVALAIFDAVDNGEEEIFPDPASAPMAARWRNSAAKLLERQLAQVAAVSS